MRLNEITDRVKVILKVVLLNTYETGGAARACYRLFRGLQDTDTNVSMLVRGAGQSPEVISAGTRCGGFMRALLEELPLHSYSSRQLHNFSSARVPGRGVGEAARLSPDIVHLHWIPQGFVHIESLKKLGCPIVWTLHDSWPFTGGCHLPGECTRYENECGACPVLGSTKNNDLSRRVWQRKRRSYPVDHLTVVAPSRWMEAKAKASSLLKNCTFVVIPNGVDVRIHRPGDQTSAREELGLPRNKRVILCGARHVLSDRNKGFDLLSAAVGKLSPELLAGSALVVFGDSRQPPLPSLGIEVVNRGEISDEKMVAALYRAADVMAVPSREENLPSMISEAMACGLPCVAFDVGGIGDQVRHRITGCLVPPHDVDALAAEISWLLVNAEARKLLAHNAREHAMANYSLERVARQHLALYQGLVRPL